MDKDARQSFEDELRGLLLASHESARNRLGVTDVDTIQYIQTGKDMLETMMRGRRFLDKVITAAMMAGKVEAKKP